MSKPLMMIVVVLVQFFLIACLFLKLSGFTSRVNMLETGTARALDNAKSAVAIAASIDVTNHRLEEIAHQVKELNPGWVEPIPCGSCGLDLTAAIATGDSFCDCCGREIPQGYTI